MKTLIELFESSVEKFSDYPLMWEKVNGKYISYSYRQISEEVYNFGAGLISIGIKKGDRIGLIAEGRTDWLVGELGMFYAGAVNIPLSVKLDAGSEIAFRLNHSGARMVVASWTQVEKIEAILRDVPDVEKIIYLDKIDTPMEHRISFQSIK